MIKLGLTGSIGMGKSTTASMFRDAGIPVWDADAAVHEIYGVGGTAVEPIQSLFPDAIVDNAVSRDALKKIIQSDPDALTAIEQIVHPLVADHRADFIAAHADAELVVFDIPLLFETGADAWLDKVVVVSCPAEVQAERVLSRGTMTPEQFDMIRSRQMPDAEKRARADYVIETLTLDGTAADVRHLISDLTHGANHA